MSPDLARLVATHVRDIADFPTPGILFKDVTPLLLDGPAFAAVVRDIADRHRGSVDLVAGIEARGFVIGAGVALDLGVGFVPVRKAGKLPGATIGLDYELEYGSSRLEVHADSLPRGTRALLVDDVLATGGTAVAGWRLLEHAGATVVGLEVLIELVSLPGRERLNGRPMHSLLAV